MTESYVDKLAMINNKIHGSIWTDADECELIAEIIREAGDGLHLEIGTAHGGTAIVAGLVKKEYGISGGVVTIDPMVGGWWDHGDGNGDTPTRQTVLDNISKFDIDCTSIVGYSQDIIPANDFKPVTTFIDGDHSHWGCLWDWNLVKDITEKFVIFHDYNFDNPKLAGVIKVVDEIASIDSEWQRYKEVNRVVVFKRLEYD